MMELAQDDVAHRHGERRVGALLHRDPEIGELRGFRIVRADDDALGAAIARLGVEVRVGRARLRDVRAPQDQEAGIVPVGAFRHVGLLAPGLRRGRRQVAVPVVERHAHAAEQRQIARAGGVGHHRHRRDRREADDAVGAVGLRRVGVGGGDDLGDLVPGRAHEAAEPALAGVGRALLRILDDRRPGGDRRAQRARLAPQLEQARAHQRIFHAVAGIEVPGVARAARAAARLVVRQLGPRARIVGLLRLPGDDAALDVDLPRARAGAVRAMGRAHDLVVLPALAIAVLPAPVLVGGDAVTVGELARRSRLKKVRRSRKWLIVCRPSFGGSHGDGGSIGAAAAALDVVEQAAAARVEAPGDQRRSSRRRRRSPTAPPPRRRSARSTCRRPSG